MRRSLTAAAILLLGPVATLVGQAADVVFVNETGVTLFYLYASSSTSDSWGEDLLGAAVVGDGGSIRIRLRASVRHLDVRAIDADGAEYIVWRAPGTSGSRIVITAADRVSAGSPTDGVAWLNLVNDTNYEIRDVRVLPTGTTDWDRALPLLPARRVIHNGENYRLELDVEALELLIVDIRLVDEDGDVYLRRGIDLETETHVVITLEDLYR